MWSLTLLLLQDLKHDFSRSVHDDAVELVLLSLSAKNLILGEASDSAESVDFNESLELVKFADRAELTKTSVRGNDRPGALYSLISNISSSNAFTTDIIRKKMCVNYNKC